MTLTSIEIANAEEDVLALEQIINGPDTAVVVTRLGRPVKSIAKVIRELRETVLTPPDYAGPPGPPGGNVMAIPTFVGAAGVAIDAGTNLVRTSSYYAAGILGGAEYTYRAGLDAAYVAAWPAVSFQAADTRVFVLSIDQILNWRQFGLKVDDDARTGTDDNAAFVAMMAWARLQRLNGVGIRQYGGGGTKTIWCYGAAYMAASRIDLDWAFHLKGFSQGIPGASPTQMRWADGTPGILIDPLNTGQAAGYIFEGFTLVGGFVDIENPACRALEWNVKGTRRNIQVYDWSGDGMYCDNTAGGGTGNSNGDITDRVWISNCTRGHVSKGADTNGNEYTGIQAGCRQCGIWEEDNIGAFYEAYELEANARLAWNSGADANHPCSYTSYGGYVYAAIRDSEVWCKTHSPTGAPTHNQGWAYMYAGGPSPATGCPAWFNGIYVRPGGGIIHIGASSMSSFRGYVEDDEASQFDGLAVILHPVGHDFNFRVAGEAGLGIFDPNHPFPPIQRTTQGTLKFGGSSGTQFPDSPIFAASPQQFFGPQGGTAADGDVYFENTNFYSFVNFRNWTAGVPHVDGQLVGVHGTGFFYSVPAGYVHIFNVNGVRICQIDSASFGPSADNSFNLGYGGGRWKEIFCANNVINTSDARHKLFVKPIEDRLLDAWGKVNWSQFKFKDSVSEKGDGARLHFGLIAQQVRDTFKAAGIDGFSLGLLCYDEWDDRYEDVTEEVEGTQRIPVTVHPEPDDSPDHKKTARTSVEWKDVKVAVTRPVLDDEGKVKQRLLTRKGNAFGLRYSQAQALEAAYQRRRADRVESRLAALETTVERLASAA